MEKDLDVIVVGELNVDLILNSIQGFPVVGKEIIAKNMDLTLGSSSAIFASNISKLGAKTAIIGKVGKDLFGKLIISSLQESGVDVSLIIEDAFLTTGATVVLNVDEDRANLTHPGAMDHLVFEDIGIEQLQRARHLHLSSVFLQNGLQKDVGRLFKLAKQLGLTTSFDMQWDPNEKWELDLPGILPHVDIFLPNQTELLLATKSTLLEEAIEKVKKWCKVLVIKRGRKGSLVFYNGKSRDMPPFLNEKVVDSIGAGDSFNAGFVWKYINQSPVEECQRFGNLTGAVSTTYPGGTTAFKNMEVFKQIALEKFGESL
ncbi:carbohydrate kinase family protein [Flexithrix dorotheae]|uniref:carbohydrate kinase family protein n=1 Tax=Flexithrix dorotheae TaxID=70993 RepID=UPI00036D0505|nr:carbohydrate kinase family protein [Flexithrix dorotheae]